jgi:hypothetical protein
MLWQFLLIVGSLAAFGFHVGMYLQVCLCFHPSWAGVIPHHVSLRFRGLYLTEKLLSPL